MASSPIFRRITLTEVKKTSNKRGSLLKELARLENEERHIIKNHHDPSYSNWRASFLIDEGMDTSGFMQTTLSGQGDTNLETIEGNVEASYQAYEGGSDALSNTAITSSGTGSGSDGGFDLGKDYLGFNGNSTPRYAALKPIDATKFDTLVVTGVRGNDSNGGEDPDAANEDLMVYYQLPGQNTIHRLDYSGGVQQSGVDYKIIPVGSGDGTLKDWTLGLPSYARAENIRFILYQPTHSGTGFDNYGITQINYRRTSPLTVFVSLDSPEASAFIRVGSPSKASQSKKQREKQLREQLEASKDYTDKKFGENFPGSTTPAPGEEDPTEQEKRAPRLGEFEPEVEDYNTWKQETEEENPQAKTSEKEYKKYQRDQEEKAFSKLRADQELQKTAEVMRDISDDSYAGGAEGATQDAEAIDKVYNQYAKTGETPTTGELADDFLTDNIPGYSNVIDFIDDLPWNDPANPVGAWIDKNEWWVEPVIGALAGAVAGGNAYKTPYNVPASRITAWRNTKPTKGTDGKLTNLQLYNDKGNLIGKKFINPKTGKWETMMRPTDRSSISDKARWEFDQMQHTNASVKNYETTGQNPSIKDLDSTRLARDPKAPGSMSSGPTVGSQWAIDKAAGATAGAIGAAGGKDFNTFMGDATPRGGMQLNNLAPTEQEQEGVVQNMQNAMTSLATDIGDKLTDTESGLVSLHPGVSNGSMYTAALAGDLLTSIITGLPAEIKITDAGAADFASQMDPEQFSTAVTFGQSTPMDAQNTINPVDKTDQVVSGAWAIQGGSTFNFNPDTGMLEIVSNKTLRTDSGGESVIRNDDGRIVGFTDIPTPSPARVEQITGELLKNPIIDSFMGGLANLHGFVTGTSNLYEPQGYNNAWDAMKDSPQYEEFIKEVGKVATNLAAGTVQGTASNAYALRQALLGLGMPKSEIEEMGGAVGQVGSKAEIPLDKLKEVNPKAYEELIKKAEGEGYILKDGKLEKDTEITGEAGDVLWADDPTMEKNPDTGVWQEIDWDERLKNLPSWFSTYGPAEVVELENGVKGIFGYNYSGGPTFITATSDRGERGTSHSGYGTPGYDFATNSGGTLWLGLNTGTGPDDPRGVDAYVASKNPAGPPKPELDRETGDPGTRKPPEVPRDEISLPPPEGWPDPNTDPDAYYGGTPKPETGDPGTRKPPEVPRDEITSMAPPEGWPTDSDAYVDFEIQQKTGGAVDSVDPAAYPGGYEARYNNDPQFAARMDALDADIEKFSGEEAAARKELRNLTIKFGWDVATTIFGGFVIGGAVRAVQGITAMNRLAKAAQLAKTLRATQGLSKAEAASKANLIINQAMKIPITKNMAASGLSTKLDDAANALWSSMHKSTDPATKAAANALVKAMETGSDDAVNAVMKAIEKDVYGYGQSVLKSAASVVDDIVIKGANSFDDVVANMDNLQTSMNKTYQALLKTNKQVAGEYGSVGRDMLEMLKRLRQYPNDATTLRNFNSALKRMGEIAASAGLTMGGAIAGELGVEEELASQLTDEQKEELEAQVTKAYEDDPEFAKFIDGEIDNYFNSAPVKDADNEIKTLNDEIKEAKKEARTERGDEISAAYNAYTDLRDQQKEISKEKYNAYRETQSWYEYPEYVKAEEKWQRLSKDLAPVGQNVTTDKAQLAKWQNAAKEYPAAEKAFIKASKDAQAKAKKAKEAFFAEQGPRDIKDKEESDKLYKIYKDLSTNVNWKEIEDKYAGEKVKEIQTKIDNIRSGQIDKMNALLIKLLDQVGLYDIENLIAPEGYGDPDSDEYFEFDLFSSPEEAGGMDSITGADMAASPNSPDPVKPGDVPTAPSSPYLPGKSPYNIAQGQTDYGSSGMNLKPDGTIGMPDGWGKDIDDDPTGQDILDLLGGTRAKRKVPQKDFGSVADLYGGQGVDASTLASVASQTQGGRGVKPKKKKLSRTPLGIRPQTNPTTGGRGKPPTGVKPRKKRLATPVGKYNTIPRTSKSAGTFDAIKYESYRPNGSIIIEKKQLKSPNQFFNQDDIKPDYPKDPPPEMVNNYHPDLASGEKVSQRFNKLDPASAKAMPKTGNPHIDAKVEKAKNNPDKDGPAWHKKVSDKIRKARAQQRTGTGQSNGDDSNGDGGEG